ncbi:MAG: peptide chain release factor N(5)-glutamine methyltransferase [Muribaculaceae bacterium]|nr:peptide chain release factor N(5)-glutamine methyltransferase [Muribaculaceae bacterium]
MTLKETIAAMRRRLVPIYGEGEAKAMIRLIFHSLKDWNVTDMIIHEGDEVSEYIREKILQILSRLEKEEPIQYILGEAYFYGMNLKVDRSTLIPRPETEELVDMIVKRNRCRNDLNVLDIGTGSGAIAIALSRYLPFSKVTAMDISKEALAVARENAIRLKAKINFINEDIFSWMPGKNSFDIIVSNPPYIDDSEKLLMERNVLDYEPHSALFVPDDNPLIFYSRIIEISLSALSDRGEIYFEINPRHCDELVSLLHHEGFRDIECHKDMYGKNRFISALKG